MEGGMRRTQQLSEACRSVERIQDTYVDLAEHYGRNHETAAEFEAQQPGECTQFAYNRIVHPKKVLVQ